MLSNKYYPRSESVHSKPSPTFVFLHGFLGDSNEWNQVVEQLEENDCLTIDVCRHGRSVYRECEGFDDTCKMIKETIIRRLEPNVPVILVGYSLGARIAMYGLAKQLWNGITLVGLISEGGNLGIEDIQLRQRRMESDLNWARRFSLEPIEHVLTDWYHQPIFSDLNDEQRQGLVTLRSDNLGVCVAEMLIATSLGKQPYLLDELKQQSLPIHYICGARDSKFSQLAEKSGLPYTQVAKAGHNVHKEQPNAYVACLRKFITHTCDV
ncbi:2-succinyl-6-hydroxy-2,4-cyclohexadiene-1-carboxylate synthase [Vibrio sp. RC27]